MKTPRSSSDSRTPAEKLLAHFRSLAASESRFSNDTAFWHDGALPLLRHLGYSSDEIFLEYTIWWQQDFYTIDAAVGPRRTASPWLLVEAHLFRSHSISAITRRLHLLGGLAKSIGSLGVVLLTPTTISVATTKVEQHRRIDAFTAEWAEELLVEIGRDAVKNLPASEGRPTFSLVTEEPSGLFAIDLDLLEQRLNAACNATDNQTKKTTFEALAAYLIGGLSNVTVRKQNLLTTTGEMDLICRFERIPQRATFWELVDPYFVVECKNWQKTVGAREIEILIGKLLKCRSHLGILFSRNGITGRTGRDAVGNIEAAWRQHGIIVLLVTEEEIRQVIQGRDFYSVLEHLYEHVRFSERKSTASCGKKNRPLTADGNGNERRGHR